LLGLEIKDYTDVISTFLIYVVPAHHHHAVRHNVLSVQYVAIVSADDDAIVKLCHAQVHVISHDSKFTSINISHV
jgi:hypothetical protein